MVLALFAVIVGLVSGRVAGGSFSNIARLHWKSSWLVLAWAACTATAAVAQVVFPWSHEVNGVTAARSPAPSLTWSGEMIFGLHTLGIGVLALFAWRNVRVTGSMWLLAIGLSCNAVVTANNHGMPYSPDAVAAAGIIPVNYSDLPKSTPISHPVRAGDQLAFLGDRIPIAPLRTVVSFGDLFVAFGLGAITANAMIGGDGRRWRKHAPKHRVRESPASATRGDGEAILPFADDVWSPASHPSALQTMLADQTVLFGSPMPHGGFAPLFRPAAVQPSTNVPNTSVTPSAPPSVHLSATTAWNTRLALLRLTGDPQVLLDLTDGATHDPTDIAISHAVASVLRDHEVDEETVRSVMRNAALVSTTANRDILESDVAGSDILESSA